MSWARYWATRASEALYARGATPLAARSWLTRRGRLGSTGGGGRRRWGRKWGCRRRGSKPQGHLLEAVHALLERAHGGRVRDDERAAAQGMGRLGAKNADGGERRQGPAHDHDGSCNGAWQFRFPLVVRLGGF